MGTASGNQFGRKKKKGVGERAGRKQQVKQAFWCSNTTGKSEEIPSSR